MISNTNAWKRVCYTLWAPIYNWLVVGFRKQRRRSLEVVSLQPGERVLLVGAGTGLDLDFIQPGPFLTAIDLTPVMLARLRRRARRLGLPVDARVMDGQALGFPDASFDVVILHLIVAVIPDPVRCVREVARVLRPGGRAVIFDKFISDDAQIPLALRILSPLASCLGTEVTRKLGRILAGSGLHVVHEQPAGLNGLLRITLVQKD